VNYRLSFTELVNYDAGQPSITLGITLSVSQARVFCNAKLDTGSSHCVFARNIGEELGIDIETGLRLLVGTVTGKFVAYLHEVNLSVASFEFSSLVAFAANEEFQRNVLGRHGFIEQMSIGLVDYEGKLYLGRYEA
jgi:hypothetical protein